MIELRLPDGFVGADAVQEDDRRRIAAALLDEADLALRSVDCCHAEAVYGASGGLQDYDLLAERFTLRSSAEAHGPSSQYFVPR